MQTAKLIRLPEEGGTLASEIVLDATVLSFSRGSGPDAVQRFLRGVEPCIGGQDITADQIEFSTLSRFADPREWGAYSHGLAVGE